MVGHTIDYFDGRFLSVRRTCLRRICMVGHTIGYFLIAQLMSGAIVNVFLHPIPESFNSVLYVILQEGHYSHALDFNMLLVIAT